MSNNNPVSVSTREDANSDTIFFLVFAALLIGGLGGGAYVFFDSINAGYIVAGITFILTLFIEPIRSAYFISIAVFITLGLMCGLLYLIAQAYLKSQG